LLNKMERNENKEKNERKRTAEALSKGTEKIMRILQTDIPGNLQIYPALTRIKGVSWSLSNSICNKIGFDKKRKIVSLSKEEITKLEGFIKNLELPAHLFNRRKDFDTGENMHLTGADLDLRKEFDIKRLKKIKSYKGLRHSLGQPVRGQRTRGHFRQKGKAVGVVKKKLKGK